MSLMQIPARIWGGCFSESFPRKVRAGRPQGLLPWSTGREEKLRKVGHSLPSSTQIPPCSANFASSPRIYVFCHVLGDVTLMIYE